MVYRRHRQIVTAAVAVISLLSLTGHRVTAAEPSVPEGIQTILQKWDERKARYRTLEVSGTETRMLDPMLIEARRKANFLTGNLPDAEDDIDSRPLVETTWHRLLDNTGRLRYEQQVKEMPRHDRTDVKVGELSRSLTPHNRNPEGLVYPHAMIGKYPSGGATWQPFEWSIKGMASALATEPGPDKWKLDEKREQVGKEDCLIIHIDREKGKTTVWIAPRLDYSIVRLLQEYQGAVLRKTEVIYEADPQGLWMPMTWIMELNRGRTKIQDTVHSYEYNKEFKDADFELEFPVGTLVQDNTVMEPGRGRRPRQYSVLPDGKEGTVRDFLQALRAKAGENAKPPANVEK